MQRGRGREAPRRGTRIAGAPAAIIAAGGRGERTRSKLLKQFVLLGGRPIFMWSVDLLDAAGCSPIIVTMPRSAVDEAKARLEGVRNTIVIEGGSSRQRSVAKGLAKVSSDRVVVQDAARPLASVQMVKASLDALDGADGAITAIPAGDTVKRARRSTVEETIPREDLWLAQTPQAFRTDLLRAAHKRAASEPYDAGDDAELIERYGGTIAIVPGSRLNLKITFGEDFKLAEAIAREL